MRWIKYSCFQKMRRSAVIHTTILALLFCITVLVIPESSLTAEAATPTDSISNFPASGSYSLCTKEGFRSVEKYNGAIARKIIPSEPNDAGTPGKIIYLTFDDGPSIYTRQLLTILEKYQVKATFFVVGNNPELMGMIADAGHAIGIHSVTHNYREIYASEEAYFTDLLQMQQNILDATGIRTTLVRFPGGSSNTVSCFHDGIMTALTQAVKAQGFHYFDWNVDSNDAGGARDRQTVFNNVVHGVLHQDVSVVLQHDTQGFSVEAVEDIIRWGLSNGYTFLALQASSPGFHHGVNN